MLTEPRASELQSETLDGETPPQVHHPAHLATGWAIVDLATGTEKDRPMLFRTMRVEAHENGTWLSSTDGTIALRAWVPTMAASWEGDTKGAGEELWSAVVRDPGKRALALAKYAAKVDDDDESVGTHVVKLSMGDIDFDALPGLEAPPEVLVELDDTERISLAGVEGIYPDISKVIDSWLPAKRNTLQGLESTFASVAKLSKMFFDTVDLELGERHVRVSGGFASATSFVGIASIGEDKEPEPEVAVGQVIDFGTKAFDAEDSLDGD